MRTVSNSIVPAHRALVPAGAGTTRLAEPARTAPAADARLAGQLFRDLRKALKMTLPAVAARLGTSIDVVSALESGSVRLLPPWPETARLITRYTALASIDARPVLAVLRRAFEDEARTLDVLPRGRAPVAALSKPKQGVLRQPSFAAIALQRFTRYAVGARDAERGFEHNAWRSRLKRPAGRTVIAAFASLAAATALFCSSQVVQALSPYLPGPLASYARSVNDLAMRAGASVYDGHLWIDPNDPRSRKDDKLQTGRR